MKPKAQVVQVEPRDRVLSGSDALRHWIEQVIVPILVDQYLQKKGLQQEQSDG